MIDFACKKLDLNEVIMCSLNLTKREFQIVEYLIEHSNKEFTPLQIAKRFKIGLSTSQRAFKKMYEEKLLNRKQKNLEKGGYVFVYSIREKRILKQKILDIINNWVKNVEEGIKRW